MQRFALFVDGSNQFGSLRNMGINVDDYEKFYWHVFDRAVEVWRQTYQVPDRATAQLRRVYWYEVGSIDQWNLNDPQAKEHLHRRFNDDAEIKRSYMALVGPKMVDQPQSVVAAEAFATWFADAQTWYGYKLGILDGMRRFHHAVQTQTDFIDIIDAGHWKVDLLTKSLSEKGIDTSLAVDMVALQDNYDVALILSGDADHIPSVKYLKTRNKCLGAVEFFSGYPPEKRGRNFSSQLKLAADFVVPIYEMDLVSKKLAKKGTPETTA